MHDTQAVADRSELKLALAGMIALAVAMGIGRFAFTPLLPLMQADMGLSLAQGGWLASANYLGYLVGALAATRHGPGPAALLRHGLILVVVTTALMAIGSSLLWWSAVRFIAGVASAWVLVATAALSLAHLSAPHRSRLSGVVFAGVGLGIAVAGLLCHGIALAGWSAWSGWAGLALIAAVGAGFAWHGIAERRGGAVLTANANGTAPASAGYPRPATPDNAEIIGCKGAGERAKVAGNGSLLVISYGLFGFGYILPATFLPAQARSLIADPAIFGWVWPVFGIGAMVSTLVAARWGSAVPRRVRWAVAQLVMAAGVVLPVLHGSLTALMLAALCVGSTFMVITMLGMQEARTVAGADAQRLIAAMTAAFATGQLLGPLLVSATGMAGWPIDVALALAAAGLVASTVMLGFSARPAIHPQEEGR